MDSFKPSTNAIQLHAQKENPKRGRAYVSLIMRTIFFLLTGILISGFFYLLGSGSPLKEAIGWWPYQVIVVNIFSFILLRSFCKKEGMNFFDLFGVEKQQVKKDLLLVLPILIGGGLIGSLGMFGSSYLIFGTLAPPDTMFQPLPGLALWSAVILLPITNALVETTTYMGYALPRLEDDAKNKYMPLVLVAVFLAIQHVVFPIIPESDFILWRFLSTLPVAFLVGFIYMRMRRLLSLVIVHFIMDLQLMLTYFQIQ